MVLGLNPGRDMCIIFLLLSFFLIKFLDKILFLFQGFGGKFGVQNDRMDKSAIGFESNPEKIGTNYTKTKPDIGEYYDLLLPLYFLLTYNSFQVEQNLRTYVQNSRIWPNQRRRRIKSGLPNKKSCAKRRTSWTATRLPRKP